ncbi:MAG: hypothetical protein RIS47_1302 [Bacteroidota bacterium]|jgi:hypothetical protein
MDIDNIANMIAKIASEASLKAKEQLPEIKADIEMLKRMQDPDFQLTIQILDDLLDLCMWDVGKTEFFSLIFWLREKNSSIATEYEKSYHEFIRT